MSPPAGTRVATPPPYDERPAAPTYDQQYAVPSYGDRPSSQAMEIGSRRGVVPALIAAMAVLVVAVGVGVFLLVRSPAEAETQVAAPYVSPQSVPAYPPPGDTGGSSIAPYSTTASPAPSAAQALYGQASADSATAEALTGYWVPQVSSKKVGRDGYDEALILQDFQSSVYSRPTTTFVLVRSEDFSSFSGPDFWVTLAATRFTSAAGANGWCDAEGYGAQDCYAKRLSHTDGPSGNSVPRG